MRGVVHDRHGTAPVSAEEIADASHELRMPLTVLRAELEVALRAPGGVAQLRAAIASAIEETDRLGRLAEDLLVLARSQDGSLPIAARQVGVKELLGDLAGRFAPVAARAGQTLRIAGGTACAGERVTVDPARIEQAVANLVDNALRHGDGPLTLGTRRDGRGVAIHVSDGGAGFPAGFLPRAFDRFSRADPARGRGGVGLGLAIVRMIARAHGGDAGAVNRAAGGADVWIALPTARRRPPRHDRQVTAAGGSPLIIRPCLTSS